MVIQLKNNIMSNSPLKSQSGDKAEALKSRGKQKATEQTDIMALAGQANKKKSPSDSSKAAMEIAGKRGQSLESTGEKKKAKQKKEKKKKGKGKAAKGDKMDEEAAKRKKVRKNFGLFKKIARFFNGGGEVPVLRDVKALEAAEALNLTANMLRKLKMKFDDIDIDGTGNIDSTEFYEALGEPKSPFTDAVFAIIDIDGSGMMEFDEFIRILATYCMYTQDEILRFCFEMFDKDGSGAIDEKELVELCKYVLLPSLTSPRAHRRVNAEP